MTGMLNVLVFTFCAFAVNTPHYILCCIPFLSYLRVKKRNLLLMIIITGAAMAFSEALMREHVENWKKLDTALMFSFYAICMVQYIICFRTSFFKLLYVFFIVQAYSTIINVIAKFIDISINPEHIYDSNITVYAFIILVIMLFTYPFIFYFFKNTFSRVFSQYPDKGFWRLCVTPILFFGITMIYTGIFMQQLFTHLILLVLFLFILTTGLITYYLTLRTGMDIADAIQVRVEMEGQLALQAQHYSRLTETIEHARAARHDLRHHLSVITGYARKNDNNGLQTYLKDYTDSLPEDCILSYCENYAVDAVSSHYLKIAKEAGVKLDIKFILPSKINIPDSDLCIVFGNILENAVESCIHQKSEIKFIKARCKADDGKFLLTVDNSGDDRTDRITSDRYKGLGIGLRSVHAVAEKWNGTLTFTYEDNIYKTSVIMFL